MTSVRGECCKPGLSLPEPSSPTGPGQRIEGCRLPSILPPYFILAMRPTISWNPKALLFTTTGFWHPEVPLSQAGAGGKRENPMLEMKGCESGRDRDNLNVREGVGEILDGEDPEKMISYLNFCPIRRGDVGGARGKECNIH